MKFFGGVFLNVMVIIAMGAAVSIKRYSQPAPLCSLTIVSASASQEARNYAQEMVAAYRGIVFRPHHVVDVVSQALPGLKKIVVRKTQAGYAVTATQQKPLCLINQTQVLTHDGQYIDKQYFDSALVATLLAYDVSQHNDKESQDHLRFARCFDTEVTRDYTVTWQDFSHISLRDKQDPSITLVISADMSLSPDLFKAYKEVKKELKMLPPGKRGRTWQVDMRFKNQILVC